jgi:ATP-dependent Clp protease ATP-binding subunit ClpC
VKWLLWFYPRAWRCGVPPRRGAQTFDRFTRRSRNVLRLAGEEAERLQDGSIGTEHLLLGLLLERDGVAAHVLAEFGIDPDGVRVDIKARLAEATPGVRVQVGLTPGAKRALQLSVGEANRPPGPA